MADTLMRDPLIQFLEEKAAEMRANVVKLTHIAGSGHIGGALFRPRALTFAKSKISLWSLPRGISLTNPCDRPPDGRC